MSEEDIKKMFRNTFGNVIDRCNEAERFLIFRDFIDIGICAGTIEPEIGNDLINTERQKQKDHED